MRKIVLSGLILVAVAGCTDIPIDGLSRAGWDEPSSMPPIGYPNDTWVDAKGCKFISTATGWVPQIGGNLKQVCR